MSFRQKHRESFSEKWSVSLTRPFRYSGCLSVQPSSLDRSTGKVLILEIFSCIDRKGVMIADLENGWNRCKMERRYVMEEFDMVAIAEAGKTGV